jgi:4-carboxymuconolactone decarboxylase
MSASSAAGATGGPLAAVLADYAAAMAVGEGVAARRALRRARRNGATRVMLEETALMLMLHAGYPAALEGLRVLSQVWPGRPRRTREGGPAAWMRRGKEAAKRVYGTSLGALRRNVAALHPDLDVWMIEQGYGRVLSRRGLAGPARELVAVAVLTAMGWERQLVSHLLGAVRSGAGRPAIRRAFESGLRRAAPARRSACVRAWDCVFARGAGRASTRPRRAG